jgi:hypothetical protein
LFAFSIIEFTVIGLIVGVRLRGGRGRLKVGYFTLKDGEREKVEEVGT